MKPGTYKLTQDFTSPLKFDKRFKGDWRRRQMIPRNTVFHVRECDVFPENLEAFPDNLDRFEHHTVTNGAKSQWRSMFDLLEPVPDKPSYMLKRDFSEQAATRVLDALFAQGKLTLDEIRAILESKRAQTTGENPG